MKTILTAEEIDRAFTRIAHEIIERNKGTKLCLIGIQRSGVHIVRRIAAKIEAFEKVKIPVASFDISLYRDDLSIRKDTPVVRRTDIPYNINDKKIILVDDVLFTGRSIRAALGTPMDMERPAEIQLAVLINRGQRELPISAQYVERTVPTSKDETVEVKLVEDSDFVARVTVEDRVIISHKNEVSR